MKIKNVTEREDGMIEYEVTGEDRTQFVYRADKFKSLAEVEAEIVKSLVQSAKKIKIKKDKIKKIKLEFTNARN